MNLKNLTVLSAPELNLNKLSAEGARHYNYYCVPSRKESYGLVPLKDNWKELYTILDNQVWFNTNFHKRSVSKDKIKDKTLERLKLLVESGDYESIDSIDKETVEDITNAVEASLLPDANYTNKQVYTCIDTRTKRLYVFSSSTKEVECIVEILSGMLLLDADALSNVQVENLSDTLTSMLIDNSLPDPIEWGDKITLVGEDKSKGTLDRNSVEGKECHAMIDAGKMFSQGKFIYDGFISYELTSEFVFKGLTFDSKIEGVDEDDTLCKTLQYTVVELNDMVKRLEEVLHVN